MTDSGADSAAFPRGVIFDMDGVLLESEELHIEAWHEYFGTLGLVKSRGFYESFVGASDRVLIRHLLETGELGGAEDRHAEGKRRVYARILRSRGRLYAGARELLEAVAAGDPPVRLALATSAYREEVAIARKLGLDGRFHATVTAEDVTRPKPDPEVYLTAARLLGVPPERCVAVEDSVPGVAAARRAGMRVVAVAQTRPAALLEEADVVVSSVLDLAARSEILRG